MPMPLSKKAVKCFADSPSFELLKGVLPEPFAATFVLSPQEECIGLYHNTDSLRELMLITDRGLHVVFRYEENAKFISYSNIDEISWMDPDKLETLANVEKRQLKLHLKDGSVLDCPVRGKWFSPSLQCGGTDVANLHTFLYAAMNIRSIHEKKELIQ